MGKNLVIILAGGSGERLLLLSEHRAKPAVPFCGPYRIIDFALSNCANSGLHDIYVLSQYRPHSLARHIDSGRSWNLDRDEGGIVILQPYVGTESRWYSGNADAVFQNLHFIEERSAENVLILGGDHVYTMDYRPMLEFHRESKADLTIGVKQVRRGDLHKFGTCVVNREGRIESFMEKVPNAPTNLASMGIYVFKSELLSACLPADYLNPASSHDFGRDIIPALIGDRKVFAYEFEGYWEDVGTINTYYEVSMKMLDPSPPVDLDSEEWPIKTNYIDLPPARMTGSCAVSEAMVGDGAIVGGTVEHSHIGPEVTVEEGAVVRDSIVLPGCTIGRGAKVNLAIIDKHCTVGEGAVIGYGVDFTPNEARPAVMKSGITLVGRGTDVPPSAVIGRNCLIGSRRPEDLVHVPSGKAVL
ncbi:MAG: glucose-1-phosphate adenylyltransferase family protein [bacterium]